MFPRFLCHGPNFGNHVSSFSSCRSSRVCDAVSKFAVLVGDSDLFNWRDRVAFQFCSVLENRKWSKVVISRSLSLVRARNATKRDPRDSRFASVPSSNTTHSRTKKSQGTVKVPSVRSIPLRRKEKTETTTKWFRFSYFLIRVDLDGRERKHVSVEMKVASSQ